MFNASTSGEINAAFTNLVRDQHDALFVGNDAFFYSRRLQLAIQASRHAVPAISASREYVEAGGLMSYAILLLHGCDLNGATDILDRAGGQLRAALAAVGKPTPQAADLGELTDVDAPKL